MAPILFLLPRTQRSLNAGAMLGVPPNLCGVFLLPVFGLTIAGVSRDGAGAALGGCTCTLFRVVTTDVVTTFVQLAVTTSDGSGNYSFSVGTDGPYRVTFDLAGSPVRAGISLKSLAGV